MAYKVAIRRKSHSDWIQHQSCLAYQQSHGNAACRTHKSWTIDPSTASVFEEEICQCGYEREAVRSNKVLPFLGLHALSGPAAKQSEVDIKSHGKSPESVNAQKPVRYQNPCYHFVCHDSHLDCKSLELAQRGVRASRDSILCY